MATNYEIESVKTSVIDSIVNKKLRQYTKAISDELGKVDKSFWKVAFNANEVKALFKNSADNPIAEDIKTQYGTMKKYCEAIGVGEATFHNGAKAVKFMEDNHLIPQMLTKSGKSVVDYDKMVMSVGQAVAYSALTESELEAVKVYCEENGTTLNMYTVGMIRRWKDHGSFEALPSEGRHRIASKDDAKADTKTETKADTKTETKADTKADNEVIQDGLGDKVTRINIPDDSQAVSPELAKERFIENILDIMFANKIMLSDLAMAYNARIAKG